MVQKRKLSELTSQETEKLIRTLSEFKEVLDEKNQDAKSVMESLEHIMGKLQVAAAHPSPDYRIPVKDHEVIVDTTTPTHPPNYTEIYAMRERDPSAAWRELDKRVASMYAPIADLKTRQNALVPISRLPPEILTDIFMFVMSLHQSDCPRDAMQFLRLTEVCRYWRSTMIDSPRLWSSLLFSNAELTARMLQHSKSSSLVVRADSTTSGVDRDALKLALLHISRIRVLQIRAQALDKLLSEIDQPAPLLEFLRLANQDKHSTVTLPPLLFQGVTPQLRHFAVYHVHVPWHQLPHGLAHLEIRHYRWAFGPTLERSLSAFRNVLFHCPALTTLILHNTFPYPCEDQHQSQCPVALPRLSHLQLVGDVEDCSAVIHLISFPPTTTIVLRCTLDAPPHPELSQVLSRLGSHRGIHFRKGSIDLESGHSESCARFQLWTKADENLNPLRVPLLDLSFLGDTQFHRAGSATIVSRICRELSLTRLPRLSIDISRQSGFASDLWQTMLGDFDGLQALSVRASGVDGLLSVLEPVTTDGMWSPNEMILPDLQELSLLGVHFTTGDTLELLWGCLLQRQMMGADIETLRFCHCINLYRSQVKKLKQNVTSVRWDGIEQGNEWENDDDDDDQGEEAEEEEEEEEEGAEYHYEW